MMVAAELIEDGMFLPRQDKIVSFVEECVENYETGNPNRLRNYLLFKAREKGLSDFERENISEIPEGMLMQIINEANYLRNERRKRTDVGRSLKGPIGYVVRPVDEHPCAEYVPTTWSECKVEPIRNPFTPQVVAALAKFILIGTQLARPVYADGRIPISIEGIFQDEIIKGSSAFYRDCALDVPEGGFEWGVFESLSPTAKVEVALSGAKEVTGNYNDQRGRMQAESERLERAIKNNDEQKKEFERAISTLKRKFSTVQSMPKYTPAKTPENLSENFVSENVKKYVSVTYDNLKNLYGNAKKVTQDKIYRMALAEKMSLDGMTRSEISEYLGVSEKTVIIYLTEIGKTSRELRMERMANVSRGMLERNVDSQRNYFGRFA